MYKSVLNIEMMRLITEEVTVARFIIASYLQISGTMDLSMRGTSQN